MKMRNEKIYHSQITYSKISFYQVFALSQDYSEKYGGMSTWIVAEKQVVNAALSGTFERSSWEN